MERQKTPILPWLVAAGAAALAWTAWRQMQQPYYPDVALHAGLELLSRKHRVLAIGPHPDDVECFAGGTLKLLSLGGSAVTVAVLSRGERATGRANIAEIRTREAEQGAAIMGANLIQLDLPDGGIRPGPVLDQALDDLMKRVEPDVVLAFDPKGPLPFGNNLDHLALGAAVLDRCRDGLADGLRVYLYGARRPNVLVDVTEVLHEKTNAMRAHRSQLAGPDWISARWTQAVSTLYNQQTPSFFAEGFYRLV